MKERFSKVTAMVLIIIQISMMVPAQEIIIGMERGKERLDQYLDRASIERSASKWERIAETGLEAALMEWESEHIYMKEQGGELWEKEYSKAKSYYEKEKEKAYIGWASSIYYEQRVGLSESSLMGALSQASKEWTYKDGKSVEGTRVVSIEESEKAEKQWQEESEKIIAEYMKEWESKNQIVYGELQGRFNELGMSESEKEEIYKEVRESYGSYVKQEYTRVAEIESNRLLMEILYDQHSLKKLSSSQAASVIAQEMAREAEASTAESLEELFKRLDLLMEKDEEEGIQIEGSKWLEEFRKTFEEGLKKWEEAELGFLSSRAEWEKEAEEIYIESEEVWAKAYAELGKRQKEWEEELLKKLDEGYKKWQSSEEKLALEIKTAKEEFIAASIENRNTKEKLIEVQVEIYNRSRELLSNAQEGIEIWYELWGERYKGVYNYWKTEGEEDKEELYADLDKVFKDINILDISGNGEKNADLITKELHKWKDNYLNMLRDYFNKAKLAIENYVNIDKIIIANLKIKKETEKDIKEIASLDSLISWKEGELQKRQDQINKFESLSGELKALHRDTSEITIEIVINKIIQQTNIHDIEETYKEFNFDKELWVSQKSLTDTDTGLLYIARKYRDNADKSVVSLYKLTGINITKDGILGYYGELETEILKAQAVLSYWEEELEVAQALDDYAQKYTSDIEGADSTLDNLSKAKQAYKESVKKYEESIEVVKAKGLLVDESNKELSEVQKELTRKKEAVDAARKEYTDVIAVVKDVGSDVVKKKLSEFIVMMEKELNNKNLAQEVISYYKTAHEYADALRKREIYDVIQVLKHGDKRSVDGGIAKDSIEKLKEKQIDVKNVLKENIEKIINRVNYPEELFQENTQLKMLQELYKKSKDNKEKDTLAEAIKALWEIAEYYYENQIKEREESIQYILLGVLGEKKEGEQKEAILDSQTLKEKEVRSWLLGRKEGIKKELEIIAKQELEITIKQELINKYNELNNLINIVINIKDQELFYKKITEYRNSNELFDMLIKQKQILSTPSEAFALLAYKQEQNKEKLLEIKRRDRIKETYGHYETNKINTENLESREKVAEKINGFNINNITHYEEIESYIKELRQEGNGLNSSGQEALEMYIKGVIEYISVKTLNNGTLGNIETLETLQENYENETKKYSDYNNWKYNIYEISKYFEIMGNENYKKLPEESKKVFREYASEKIIQELTKTELLLCIDINSIETVLKQRNDQVESKIKSNHWTTLLLNLNKEEKQGIYENLVKLYRNQESDRKYEVYGEWLDEYVSALENDNIDRLWEISSKNKDIEIAKYYKVQKFLEEYSQYNMFIDSLDKEVKSYYQEAIVQGLLQEDIEKLTKASGVVFNTLLEQYNENEENSYNIEQRLIKLLTTNNIIESYNIILNELKESALLNNPEEWNGKEITLEQGFVSQLETLVNDYKTEIKANVETDFSEMCEENGYTVYYQKVKQEEQTNNIYSMLYRFYLTGAPLLYTYLSSPYGSSERQEGIKYLRELDNGLVSKIESYEKVDKALDSYSLLMDDNITTWLENYSVKHSLNDKEKDCIYNALTYGIVLRDKEYDYRREQEELSKKEGGVLQGLIRREQERLHQIINILIEESIEKIQKEKDRYVYVQYVYQEIKDNRMQWISDLSSQELDKVETQIIGDIEKKIPNVLNKEELKRINTIISTGREQIYKRLEEQQKAYGSYFTDTTINWIDYTFYKEKDGIVSTESTLKAVNESRMIYLNSMSRFESLRMNIKRQLSMLKLYEKDEKDIKAEANRLAKDITKKLDEYNDYIKDTYEKTVLNVESAYKIYNQAIDESEKHYTVAKEKRLDQRKKQEIYDWAQSIYLKGFGENEREEDTVDTIKDIYVSPKETLSEVAYAHQRAQASLDVLRELSGEPVVLDSDYSTLLARYKDTTKKYYLSRVVAYETELAIAKQEEIVKEATRAEELSRNALVQGSNNKIKAESTDAVIMKSTGNGTYTLELAYKVELFERIDMNTVVDEEGNYKTYYEYETINKGLSRSQEDEKIYEDYFNELSEEIEKVGGKEKVSKAELEALAWLDRVSLQGTDYLEKIMLASMFIKSSIKIDSEERKKWYEDGEDPNIKPGTYTLGAIPLNNSFHGVDIASEYLNARKDVMANAYNDVMSSEQGREDVNRYLLYRDKNVSFDVSLREKRVLEAKSIDYLVNELEDQKKENNIMAAAMYASGMAMTASAAFCPWLLIPAAALFIVAGTYYFRAKSLEIVSDHIKELITGRLANLDEDRDEYKSNYKDWVEKREILAREWKKLNKMYYGVEVKPVIGKEADGTDKISNIGYEQFLVGVKEVLEGDDKAITYAEASSLYTKELFDKSRAGSYGTVSEALKAVNDYYEVEQVKNDNEILDKERELKEKQKKHGEVFDQSVKERQKISDKDKKELEKLATIASDKTKSIIERQEASEAYEEKLLEITPASEDVKKELKELAKKAWGNGSWNSESHLISMMNIIHDGNGNGLYNSKVIYGRNSESYTLEVQNQLKERILKSVDIINQSQLAIKEKEWDLLRTDLIKQKTSWEEQANQIKKIALREWKKAQGKLNEGYNSWRQNFKKEYDEKTLLWEESYTDFLQSKQDWVEEQYVYASNVGSAHLLQQTGAPVESLIATSLSKTIIHSMNREEMNVDMYVDTLLEGTNLSGLMSYAGNIEDRGNNVSGIVKQGVKRDTSVRSLSLAESVLREASEDMRNVAAKLAAYQAGKMVEETKKWYAKKLETENEGMKNWQKDLVRDNGYTIENEISREAVTGSTTFGAIKERQTVHRYEYFRTQEALLSVSLDVASIEGLESDTILLLVNQAQEDLSAWEEKIFGRTEDNRVKYLRIPRGLGESSGQEYRAASEDDDFLSEYTEIEEEIKILEEKGFKNLTELERKKYVELKNKTVDVRDGELGAHIGYSPLFKDDIDYKKSARDNIESVGAGQMGRIMLDFEWNEIQNRNGYAELSKPMYDQKLWKEEFLGFEAPTVRDITSIAMEIIGTATSQKWLSFVDDLLFAGLDLSGGYKEPGLIANELIKTGLTFAVSAGIGAGSKALTGGLGKILGDTVMKGMGGIAINAGISASSSYLTSVGNSYINAMDFTKLGTNDWINREQANSSWGNVGNIAGALSAGVSSGIAGGLGNKLNAEQNKFYGGLVNLASMAGGEATRYGVYAGYSLAQGSGSVLDRLGQAYDTMGGITINVANVGSFVDMIGSGIARNNSTGQSNLDLYAQRLKGTGILEVNFGSKGITSKLGTRGLDIGGAIYDIGKRSYDRKELEKNRIKNGESGESAYHNYVYGDWTAENTSMRLASGLDEIEYIGEEKGYTAKTSSNGRGGRTIEMVNSGNAYNNAITLQHESYRNGVIDGNNAQETLQATKAHTEMALKMMSDGAGLGLNKNLLKDINNYYKGSANFNKYVEDNYDSSDDYWRLMNDGSIKYDGLSTLTDENGDVILNLENMGIESSLAYILGIDRNDKEAMHEMRLMMENSGIKHSVGNSLDGRDSENWYWSGEREVQVGMYGSFPDTENMNLTEVNINNANSIGLNLIKDLYDNLEIDKSIIGKFIDRTYRSPIDFLNYATDNLSVANSMLSKIYTSDEMEMIHINKEWFNNVLANGQDTRNLMTGNKPEQTQEFGAESYIEGITGSTVPGATNLFERHPAIDFGSGGDILKLPGGFWTYEKVENRYIAVLELFGGDLRMRINHLNNIELAAREENTIWGGYDGRAGTIFNYPQQSYGTGTGAHTHIEMTRKLPYNGSYTRQYVNPNTLKAGDSLEYELIYYDNDNNILETRTYNRNF